MKPFLKYPGGKRKYADRILERLQLDSRERLVVPFTGGGAVAIAAMSENPARPTLLADLSPEVANTWMAVRDEVEFVIEELEMITEIYYEGDALQRESDYYDVRLHPKSLDPAVRTVFLNHLGFNGLQRVNRKGEPNVPWGKDTSHFDVDRWAENARGVSQLLQGVTIRNQGFEMTMVGCQSTDAVFLDPPYLGGFVGYTKEGWDESDHERLVKYAGDLVNRGARVVVTDSGLPSVRKRWIHAGFGVEELLEHRAVNSDGGGRGAVGCLMASAG